MKYFCLAIKIFFVFNSLQNVKMFQSVKNNFRRIFLKKYCENMLSEIFFFKFYFFQNFSFFETKELTSTVTIVLFLLSIYIYMVNEIFLFSNKIFF